MCRYGLKQLTELSIMIKTGCFSGQGSEFSGDVYTEPRGISD